MAVTLLFTKMQELICVLYVVTQAYMLVNISQAFMIAVCDAERKEQYRALWCHMFCSSPFCHKTTCNGGAGFFSLQ